MASAFPEKKEAVDQLYQLYQTMIAPISKVAYQFQGMPDHPQLRESGNQAIEQAYSYFKSFVNQLYGLNGRNSMGQFMKKM